MAETVGPSGSIGRALQARGAAFFLFSRAEQGRVLTTAMVDALTRWIDEKLPLRFSPYAARLGWTVGKKHQKQKKYWGVEDPLVWTGITRASVLSRAKATAVGNLENLRGRISLGPVWPQAKVQSVLRTVPSWEVDDIGIWLGEAIDTLLSGAFTITRPARGHKEARTLRTVNLEAVGTFKATSADRLRLRADLASAVKDAIIGRRAANRQGRPGPSESTLEIWRNTHGGSAPTGYGAPTFAPMVSRAAQLRGAAGRYRMNNREQINARRRARYARAAGAVA